MNGAALLFVLAADVGGFVLDWDTTDAAVRAADPAEIAKTFQELGIRLGVQKYDGTGRALGYAGEDAGLLCFLLGLKAGAGDSWLRSPDMNIQLVGLGTYVQGEIPVSRAALAPLSGKRWLLLLSEAASLDLERLRRHMAAPGTRKQIHERIVNLLRDAHEAFNSSQPKPPRLAYPGLSRDELFEVGDPESEELFGLRTSGKVRRVIERRDLPTGGRFIDDGISVEGDGAAIGFSLDLHPLISDDLLLVGRTTASGKGQVVVDGVPLADWVPQESGDSWGETIVRIPNRLLDGKEKTWFEVRPTPDGRISLFRLQVLRVPSAGGNYLSGAKPVSVSGTLENDRSWRKGPLVIGGYRFLKGIGTTAPSSIAYSLDGSYRSFEAFVGMDSIGASEKAAIFRVLVDGEERHNSSKMYRKDLPRTVTVSIEGAKELRLVVECPGETVKPSSAIWAEARLLK